MSYHEAICILNAIRNGHGDHFSHGVVTMALRLTGDIDE